MIYLVLSIFCSTTIVLLFRSFTNHKIDSFQAIVFNYLTCMIIGLASVNSDQLGEIFHWDGLPWAILLGALFIGMFYLMARTTQILGVTVSSVAQKLSFVIPVIAGIVMFNEIFNVKKAIGFLLAILAVIFISIRRDDISLKGYFWMPFLIFAGSGVCDLIIKMVESYHLGVVNKATFAVVLFGTAFVLGLFWMIGRIATTNQSFSSKSILAGFILGVPNYGSIYFLITALQQSGLEASQVFPINNVGVILLSALLAWLIFTERLNKIQLSGLVMALAAIIILV